MELGVTVKFVLLLSWELRSCALISGNFELITYDQSLYAAALCFSAPSGTSRLGIASWRAKGRAAWPRSETSGWPGTFTGTVQNPLVTAKDFGVRSSSFGLKKPTPIVANKNFLTQVCNGEKHLLRHTRLKRWGFTCPAAYANARSDGLGQEKRQRQQFVQPARAMFSVQSDVLSLQMCFSLFLSFFLRRASRAPHYSLLALLAFFFCCCCCYCPFVV